MGSKNRKDIVFSVINFFEHVPIPQLCLVKPLGTHRQDCQIGRGPEGFCALPGGIEQGRMDEQWRLGPASNLQQNAHCSRQHLDSGSSCGSWVWVVSSQLISVA